MIMQFEETGNLGVVLPGRGRKPVGTEIVKKSVERNTVPELFFNKWSISDTTLPDLKASIIRHVAEIPHELSRSNIENAIMRFQHIIDANGAYIEHIL
ncbi:hypothetical protein TNCV_4095011 [Trichonephila clavipes]|uniref:Uncharacterized protein n=1 Tax=Trichonephila clavipes TaxID=2585209 RepID=A0A8X6S6X9_TRICX|nr:hypothetical protein TNCV_4095011 [Trichonephila clavipes]